MRLDERLAIDRIQGAPALAGSAAKAKTGFAELLAGLEAAEPGAAATSELHALGDALQRADADFAAAMVLRRTLEETFRRLQP